MVLKKILTSISIFYILKIESLKTKSYLLVKLYSRKLMRTLIFPSNLCIIIKNMKDIKSAMTMINLINMINVINMINMMKTMNEKNINKTIKYIFFYINAK